MLRPTAGVVALLCTTLTACGGRDGARELPVIGDTLTIYSSAPLSGPLGAAGDHLVKAEKLALKEAGGRVGAYNVAYVSLDSADPESGRWNPARVAANARAAVQTPNTVAYLGEAEHAASTASLPVVNAAGVLQVSPRDTYAGLTEPGAPGEPERWSPSGRPSFARLVPTDEAQAAALVRLLGEGRAGRIVVAERARVPGATLGDRLARRAAAAGIEVAARTGGDPAEVLRAVRRARADAIVATGTDPEVLRAVHAGRPATRLLAADDLARRPDLAERAGRAARRLELVGVTAPADPGFERRFLAEFGERPAADAVLGYRAMRLVLDAVRRAGAGASSRRRVAALARESSPEPVGRLARLRVQRGVVVTVRSPL